MNSRTEKSLGGVTPRQGNQPEPFLSIKGRGDDLAIFDALPGEPEAMAAHLVFGGLDFHNAACSRLGAKPGPMLWIQGDVCPGREVWGRQALIPTGQPVRRIELEGRVVGSAWSDQDADYCLLAGILPREPGAGRGTQTTQCFESIEAALGVTGMNFSHVARTWLYLDHLLDWYDEFNVARTAFFASRGVFNGLIPASTGIGGRNPAGAALTAGALAVRPRHPGVTVREVDSPLQGPATDYRSSFSRAVEIATPTQRTLLVSGSASIAPDGRTLHEGDVVRQIHLTLDVVEGLLNACGMGWHEVTRSIGYFYEMGDLPAFEACCRERRIPALPLVAAHAIVCRGDLLFELELDAVLATSGRASGPQGRPLP